MTRFLRMLTARSEKRVIVNFGVFLLLGVLLLVWAAFNIIRLDAVERPFRVTASFETSPGLRPDFQVAFLGVQIGTIDKVELEDKEAVVTLKLFRGTELPRNVGAAVRRQSAVGEPYVDLIPPKAGREAKERLAVGDHIPISRTEVPVAYSELFEILDNLVTVIDPEDLRTLSHELAVGLEGRGASIRKILEGAGRFTSSLAENADLVDEVIDDLTRLTGTLAQHREPLGRGFDNLASLASGLRASGDDIATLLEEGPSASKLVTDILRGAEGDIGCIVGSLGTVAGRLGEPDMTAEIARLLGLAPKAADVFRNVSTVLPDGRFFLRIMTILNAGAGTQPPSFYPERERLPIPPPIRECPAAASTDAATGDPAPAGSGGRAEPEARDRRSPVSSRPDDEAAFPASSTKDVGGEFPIIPIVAALAVLGAAGLAWRLLPFGARKSR